MSTKKVYSNGIANGTDTMELKSLPKKSKKSKSKLTAQMLSIQPDITEQLTGNFDQKELLHVLTQVRNGNFSARMPIDQIGMTGKICDMLNDIISINERMIEEFTKAGNIIGKQGKLTERIDLPHAKGAWSTGIESLNA